MTRLALSRREVMEALGVSRNFIRRLERDGTFNVVKLGAKVLIPVADLERLGLFPTPQQASKKGGV